ncbi:MAG: hypothetical protein IJV01_02460 [Bacteroidales bacterium]|nr:hypothetical protein [Bacteroidales bacterium]
MKRLFFVLLTLLAGLTVSAQDIIIKKSGASIRAKVLEERATEVSYKAFSNLDGPTYILPKSEIFSITYANGQKSEFVEVKDQPGRPLDGKMRYNFWRGRLMIDKTIVTKEISHLYLSEEAEKTYQRGHILRSVGDGMIAFGVGFALEETASALLQEESLGSRKLAYYIGGGLVLCGLPLHFAGMKRINAAIADYNARHGFAELHPSLDFGLQPHGLGLALNF